MKVVVLELVRIVSFVLALACLIPTPSSETNEVSIDPIVFMVGAAGFMTFMIMTCLIASRARLYGLLSTGLASATLIGAVYAGMWYWQLIH